MLSAPCPAFYGKLPFLKMAFISISKKCLSSFSHTYTNVEAAWTKDPLLDRLALSLDYCSGGWNQVSILPIAILSFASYLQQSSSLSLTCWNWKCNLPKITDEGFFVLTFCVGLILWAGDLPHGETSKNYQLAIPKTVIFSWGPRSIELHMRC